MKSCGRRDSITDNGRSPQARGRKDVESYPDEAADTMAMVRKAVACLSSRRRTAIKSMARSCGILSSTHDEGCE